MEIYYLHDQPEYVEIVARWIFNEFVKQSRSKFSFEYVLEFFKDTNINNFPITLVAVEDGKCKGTVSIFENDLKTQEDLRPWLASLYVIPESRNQRIGKRLINETFEITKGLGFNAIYLRTEHAAKYYGKLGWDSLCKTHDEYGQITEIFKYNLF